MPNCDQRPLAIFLMGPTASGKTALALRLAERFTLGLISVDSALVYRGLDIGTAKPDAATLARAPHRLIDIREPNQVYSAADFRLDALREMAEITSAGRIPLLVGGTGLYFRALRDGLSELPQADPKLRADLAREAKVNGWSFLHRRLSELDPIAAARIRATDQQRIQRALEVIALTNRPLSEQQGLIAARFGYRVLKLALLPTARINLHARIAARFDAMLEQGFLAEVMHLGQRCDVHDALPALRAVGYRQALEYLAGKTDFAGFRDRAIFATRQLAKRQITWLRSELDTLAFEPDAADHMDKTLRTVAAFVGEHKKIMSVDPKNG